MKPDEAFGQLNVLIKLDSGRGLDLKKGELRMVAKKDFLLSFASNVCIHSLNKKNFDTIDTTI